MYSKYRAMDLEEFVLLAEVDRLLPAVVALVQVCTDAPELNELVLLQTLGQSNVVEVVECINRRPQTLVVLFLDEKIVQRLVDCLVVVVLQSKIIIHHHSSSDEYE